MQFNKGQRSAANDFSGVREKNAREPPVAPQAPEGVVQVRKPSERVVTLVRYLQALYLKARREGLCHEAASLYAVAPSEYLSHYVPPIHFDASGDCPCECAKVALPLTVSELDLAEFEIRALVDQMSDVTSEDTELDELREHLALLDEGEKAMACRDKLLGRYRWKKALELEANVKKVFESQYVRTRHTSSNEGSTESMREERLLGCAHYARNCKLKAKCCGLFVTCRFCHDEAMSEDHEMDRFATEQVLCMNCLTEQPVSARCNNCDIEFGHHFCRSCRFFENTPGKKVYHCDRCNICRLGAGLGIDNYHCDKCDACVSLQSKAHHRCISKALHTNCPVCHGYLFTSRQPVVFMRCGHTMHSDCFEEHTARSYQCPLCMRSLTDMHKYFEQIDEIVRNEPMPPEYDHKRSFVLCNDCGTKCVARFHFMYHKCEKCRGYNTKVLRIFDVNAKQQPGASKTSSAVDQHVPEELSVLHEASSGDFSGRMKSDVVGKNGKDVDAFHEDDSCRSVAKEIASNNVDAGEELQCAASPVRECAGMV